MFCRSAAGPGPSQSRLFLEHLGKRVNNRPKRKKTLVSHLLALSGNAATEADVVVLVERLCKDGRLSIGDKEAVTYHD
jgi:hypothetical protein